MLNQVKKAEFKPTSLKSSKKNNSKNLILSSLVTISLLASTNLLAGTNEAQEARGLSMMRSISAPSEIIRSGSSVFSLRRMAMGLLATVASMVDAREAGHSDVIMPGEAAPSARSGARVESLDIADYASFLETKGAREHDADSTRSLRGGSVLDSHDHGLGLLDSSLGKWPTLLTVDGQEFAMDVGGSGATSYFSSVKYASAPKTVILKNPDLSTSSPYHFTLGTGLESIFTGTTDAELHFHTTVYFYQVAGRGCINYKREKFNCPEGQMDVKYDFYYNLKSGIRKLILDVDPAGRWNVDGIRTNPKEDWDNLAKINQDEVYAQKATNLARAQAFVDALLAYYTPAPLYTPEDLDAARKVRTNSPLTYFNRVWGINTKKSTVNQYQAMEAVLAAEPDASPAPSPSSSPAAKSGSKTTTTTGGGKK